MPEYKIHKVYILHRNLHKGKLSSESFSTSRTPIPDEEAHSNDAFSETNQRLTETLGSFINPVQHWGLLVYIRDEISNNTYAKFMETHIVDGLNNGVYSDWDHAEEMPWRNEPGFNKKEVCLDGKKFPYDEEKVKEFIRKFNDKDNEYCVLFNNCQSFVEKILEVLKLDHINSPNSFKPLVVTNPFLPLVLKVCFILVGGAAILNCGILLMNMEEPTKSFEKLPDFGKFVICLIWGFVFVCCVYAHIEFLDIIRIGINKKLRISIDSQVPTSTGTICGEIKRNIGDTIKFLPRLLELIYFLGTSAAIATFSIWGSLDCLFKGFDLISITGALLGVSVFFVSLKKSNIFLLFFIISMAGCAALLGLRIQTAITFFNQN